MTSLTEAYKGNAREVASLRRLYTGTSLVLLGATLAIVAVLVATTKPFAGVVLEATAWEMANRYATVRVAGVLAGLGVPTVLVGVFIVLPASRRVRAATAISASLCLFGVVLFWYAYPYRWRYGADHITLEVSVIYLLGLFIGIWCLFTAVVNFKTRNDPGGMLEMNVTRHNQTVIETGESSPDGGLGGVGFLGEVPDGDVETQTNGGGADAQSLSYDERVHTSQRTDTATSDGGSTTADASTSRVTSNRGTEDGSDAEIVESSTGGTPPADRYCGNCSHFEYARSSSGMAPYCARYDNLMDDMDACEEWTPNRG